jgi:hypothetical protein
MSTGQHDPDDVGAGVPDVAAGGRHFARERYGFGDHDDTFVTADEDTYSIEDGVSIEQILNGDFDADQNRARSPATRTQAAMKVESAVQLPAAPVAVWGSDSSSVSNLVDRQPRSQTYKQKSQNVVAAQSNVSSHASANQYPPAPPSQGRTAVNAPEAPPPADAASETTLTDARDGTSQTTQDANDMRETRDSTVGRASEDMGSDAHTADASPNAAINAMVVPDLQGKPFRIEPIESTGQSSCSSSSQLLSTQCVDPH